MISESVKLSYNFANKWSSCDLSCSYSKINNAISSAFIILHDSCVDLLMDADLIFLTTAEAKGEGLDPVVCH